MITHVKELLTYRDLLISWTSRELRIRYKQSILGILWAILQPLALTIIFFVVFTIVIPIPSDGVPYPIFAFTALLPWTYFSASIGLGTPSLVNNMQLVTKIYFPREILPLSSIGASLVDFSIGSVFLLVLLIGYRIQVTYTLLWLPLLVIVQTLLATGIILFSSSLNAIYRDLRFLIPLIMQVWLYATPVAYPMSIVPDWLKPLYLLNPMAGIIESYRRVILFAQSPQPQVLAIASILSVVLFLTGYKFFKRTETEVVDVI